MKAPFYVVDSKRKLIVGQFFKIESANEVRDLLRAHSAEPWVSVHDSGHFSLAPMYVDNQEYKRANEADLQAIAAEKYLPKPKDADHPWYKDAVFVGGVYDFNAPEQLIAVSVTASGPKFTTWHMVGALSNRSYTVKRRKEAAGKPMIRMATVQEWKRAKGEGERRTEAKQARVATNANQIDALNVEVGDTIRVQYSDGMADEVVEAINHKNGRVAIKRRGAAAYLYDKRRFIDAKHILKVVEKSPVKRHNPINDPAWMRR